MDIHSIFIAATEAVQAAAETTQAAAESGHAAEAADPGILGTLGIDWKIFLAQLVNFSVVLLVFWKWVVKPLGKTLSDRQTKIESGLKNAEYMEEEKRKFEEWKVGEMRKTRGEAEQVLKTATDTADKIKAETIAMAQTQSGKMIEQAKAAIESEKAQMLKEVRQDVAQLVVAASEKIIRHKLDPKKDHELVAESLKDIA
jgi:F-type H+-transporting ATPase subunit b